MGDVTMTVKREVLDGSMLVSLEAMRVRRMMASLMQDESGVCEAKSFTYAALAAKVQEVRSTPAENEPGA